MCLCRVFKRGLVFHVVQEQSGCGLIKVISVEGVSLQLWSLLYSSVFVKVC